MRNVRSNNSKYSICDFDIKKTYFFKFKRQTIEIIHLRYTFKSDLKATKSIICLIMIYSNNMSYNVKYHKIVMVIQKPHIDYYSDIYTNQFKIDANK